MKQSSFLFRLFWFLMLVYGVCRIAFMLYNADLWPSAADPSVTGLDSHTWLKDMILAWFHGAAQQDLITVGTMMALPALLVMCGVRRLRLWLTPYYIIMSLVVGIIIIGDCVMYEFWQFKVGTVVLPYAAYPEGTSNSVSFAFVATRVGSGILLMATLIVGCFLLTPKATPLPADAQQPVSRGVLYHLRRHWLTAVITIAAFATFCLDTSVGSAYFSDRIFLNHAAVNPVYRFFTSAPLRDYADRYDYFDEEEREHHFDGLYAGNGAVMTTDSSTVHLLNTERPDVLFVITESFGSEFIARLGGAMGTTTDGHTEPVDPQLERLIPEGVWWSNYYSNSFRTDRGVVSAVCGWTAYTDFGYMNHPELHASLPSLPRSLHRAGYTSEFLYAGPMTNMGKGTFLANIGYQRLTDHTAFAPEDIDNSWGVNDGTSVRRVCHILNTPSDTPRLLTYMTLSSHEPWEVPYHRLTDKVQNAFSYTDHALGTLIDSLKATPAWDRLLVIIIPDHGHLYNVPVTGSPRLRHQALDDPEFFHAPMLWLGGAVREPRVVSTLTNQSDVCATLLGQLGLDHSDYPWSRDVLSADYRYPFVYSVYPAGILFRDATGTTLYDTSADRIVLQHDAGASAHHGPKAPSSSAGKARLNRAKAILQTSFDQVGQ